MQKEHEEADRAVDEHRIWKKNSLFLYDLLSANLLPWPSLTVELLPFPTTSEAKISSHRVLLGTNTNDGQKLQEQNYILYKDILLPASDCVPDPSRYSSVDGEIGGYGVIPEKDLKTRLVHSVLHDTEVNTARAMPSHPDVVASRGSDGDVRVFDRRRQPGSGGSIVPGIDKYAPQAILRGLTAEGFGLEWDRASLGTVWACDADGNAAAWALDTSLQGGAASVVLGAPASTGSINDISPSPIVPGLVALAEENGCVSLWDSRAPRAAVISVATGSAANSVSFSPLEHTLFATGLSDGRVALFDARYLKGPLHSLRYHTQEVLHVEWSPFHADVLASGSEDSRVCLWKLGGAPAPAQGMPPELAFVHAGHVAPVTGVSFSPCVPWLVASTSDDHTVMLWQPAERWLRAGAE
eukprot:gnl/Chilomastix_cuspidata/2170.p1 GENE.gnl/Chilomastix_cuspidata/2170~~gnl/Chilomastix_cuspidata/2170.p1  ORF type:complete len:419 (-),score=160.58 gnl/Chilomastix_cuspidata/2170:938-2170(-)